MGTSSEQQILWRRGRGVNHGRRWLRRARGNWLLDGKRYGQWRGTVSWASGTPILGSALDGVPVDEGAH